MNQADLIFTTVSDGEKIYDPLQVGDTPVSIKVTNYGDTAYTGLGIYIDPATNLGGADLFSNKTPETDYQDLLTMGTRTEAGLETQGGLIVSFNSNSYYVTRDRGASKKNKILIPPLAPGGTFQFDVFLEETSPSEARRYYINITVE